MDGPEAFSTVAIRVCEEADVPEQWKSWIPINYEKAPITTQITHKKDALAGTTGKECKKK